MVDFLPLLLEKTDFDCAIKNLVLIPARIYWKMNKGCMTVSDLGCRTLEFNNSILNQSPLSQQDVALVEISSHDCSIFDK